VLLLHHARRHRPPLVKGLIAKEWLIRVVLANPPAIVALQAKPHLRRRIRLLSSILNLPPIHSRLSILTLHSHPRGSDMDADLHFKIAVIGLGVLSTIMTTLVVFTH
jgi:hypothetical protein